MLRPVSLAKCIKMSSFWLCLHVSIKPPFLCQNQMEHKLQKIWEIAQGTYFLFPNNPSLVLLWAAALVLIFTILLNICRSEHRDAGLWLGPGFVPAARLSWQRAHSEEAGVVFRRAPSGHHSPPQLPRPFSVPSNLHLHTAAPAGPGRCALA